MTSRLLACFAGVLTFCGSLFLFSQGAIAEKPDEPHARLVSGSVLRKANFKVKYKIEPNPFTGIDELEPDVGSKVAFIIQEIDLAVGDELAFELGGPGSGDTLVFGDVSANDTITLLADGTFDGSWLVKSFEWIRIKGKYIAKKRMLKITLIAIKTPKCVLDNTCPGKRLPAVPLQRGMVDSTLVTITLTLFVNGQRVDYRGGYKTKSKDGEKRDTRFRLEKGKLADTAQQG